QLDLLHAAPQLIEDRSAALDEGPAVVIELHALGGPVEQPDAERALEFGDRLRDDGMGNCKAVGSARHAARLRHGEKDMEVAQPDAPPDAVRPLYALHDVALSQTAIRVPNLRTCSYSPRFDSDRAIRQADHVGKRAFLVASHPRVSRP